MSTAKIADGSCASGEGQFPSSDACCSTTTLTATCDNGSTVPALVQQPDTCCSQPACEPISAPEATPIPPGTSAVRYRVSNMDCPTEERLIRNKVEPMSGVVRLDFNLMSRTLTVHHNLDTAEGIAKALDAIGMRTEQLEKGDGEDNAEHEASPLSANQKVLLTISGIAAVAAEALAWTTHTDTSPVVAGLPPVPI